MARRRGMMMCKWYKTVLPTPFCLTEEALAGTLWTAVKSLLVPVEKMPKDRKRTVAFLDGGGL
jgi:hypothetical protein